MDVEKKISDLLDSCDPETRQLLIKILEIEKGKLYMGHPRGIYEELIQAIKEGIQ